LRAWRNSSRSRPEASCLSGERNQAISAHKKPAEKKGVHSPQVTIADVTLREYGQNIPTSYLPLFSPDIRVRIALKLMDAGFTTLEVFSCAHPRVAPAMQRKALEEVARGIGRQEGVHIITLVPNGRAYEDFLGLDLGPEGYNHTVGVFCSVVEAHNRANLGGSVSESIAETKKIMTHAADRKIRVAATLSAVFGYREPGKTEVSRADPGMISDYITLLFDRGAETVGLSDLQGVAGEQETRELLDRILNLRKGADLERLVYHPHHVSGVQALRNSRVAFDAGIRRFDASLGGTGGCVTGAPGNQPTEGLVRLLHGQGIRTGLEQDKVFGLARMVQEELYRKIPLNPPLEKGGAQK